MVFFMCQVVVDCILDILPMTLTLGLVKFYEECWYLCCSRHLTWLGVSRTFCLLLWPALPASAWFPQPSRYCLGPSCMCAARRPAWALGVGLPPVIVPRYAPGEQIYPAHAGVSPGIHKQIYGVTFSILLLPVTSSILSSSWGTGCPLLPCSHKPSTFCDCTTVTGGQRGRSSNRVCPPSAPLTAALNGEEDYLLQEYWLL